MIMEFIRGSFDALVARAVEGKMSGADVDKAYSDMEIAIREGIAQELEQLVAPSAVPRPHGMATPPDLGGAFYLVQQDFFRAAANVVRGKEHATEDDWGRQSERMKAMAELDALRKEKAEIFPMPTDAELQRKFDDQQDRMREWND